MKMQKCSFCDYHSKDATVMAQHSVTHFSWTPTSILGSHEEEMGKPKEGAKLVCHFCDLQLNCSSELEIHEQRHKLM